MSFVTTYLPGRTAIHRLPAGLKLAVLVATGVALTVLNQWWEPVAVLGVVLACYPLAGMPVRAVSGQLRSMGWVLLAIERLSADRYRDGGPRWTSSSRSSSWWSPPVWYPSPPAWKHSLRSCCGSCGRSRRFGVAPDRTALLISLSVRSVSVIAGLAQEVRDAQRARGPAGVLGPSPYRCSSGRYATLRRSARR